MPNVSVDSNKYCYERAAWHSRIQLGKSYQAQISAHDAANLTQVVAASTVCTIRNVKNTFHNSAQENC